MTTGKGVTNWGSSLQGRCGKSMDMAALAQWYRRSCVGLLGRSNADDKRGHIGSVLGCPSLEFHSQLSSLGWPCLRIKSHKPLCSAF